MKRAVSEISSKSVSRTSCATVKISESQLFCQIDVGFTHRKYRLPLKEGEIYYWINSSSVKVGRNANMTEWKVTAESGMYSVQ